MGDGPQTRIGNALRLAHDYGHAEGDHHKAWVIDQMVRALLGQRPGHDKPTAEYLEWVAAYEDGEDGPRTYCWIQGVEPS